MPEKKKQRKIKLKAVRGARASRPPTKKPSVKQTVNVFTTSTEPYRTDFRDQFRYGLGYIDPIREREQTPFQPVFNYIQPPVQAPAQAPAQAPEVKPKRKYTKKERMVAIAEPFIESGMYSMPRSRQSSGGYETEFMPSEQELERAIIAKQRKEEQRFAQEQFSPEMERFAPRESSAGDMPITKKKGGRPTGSKNKPKEEQLQQTGVQDVSQFFGKVGGSKLSSMGGGGEIPEV